MNIDTLTAERLPQLLSSCRDRATEMIKRYIEGTGDLGSIYDDLESWYGRYRDDNLPLPQYQDLPSPVKDQLFDAWIEGVEGYFAKRAAKSDSGKSEGHSSTSGSIATPSADVPPSWKDIGRCPDCGRIGAHFCDGGQPSHPGWFSKGNSSAPDHSLTIPSPSPASSPSQPLHATDPVKASPEGSVCEVEPLGWLPEEFRGTCLRFVDEFQRTCDIQADLGCVSFQLPSRAPGHFFVREHQIPSLIAHLTAWLETGSFKLNTALGEEQKGGAGV